MDLKLFFEPTGVEIETKAGSFVRAIYSNNQKMPDHNGMDIALIGLQEYRGADQDICKNSANDIRKQLYQLQKGTGEYAIIDLGNLRNGPNYQETQMRLKEVCGYLMGKEILPVIMGGSHDMDYGQYCAYEDSKKLVSILNIDNQVDLADDGLASDNHITQILRYTPNYLFDYQHLAYQSFLTNPATLSLLNQLSFDTYRLGAIKSDIKEVEPVVRHADMLSFDMSALSCTYAPASTNATIYGLSGEEACQICWYAGQNEKLTSIGIYDYLSEKDTDNDDNAFVIATMIWYFIEGYYHRKDESVFFGNDYMVYEVHFGGNPESIRFYKSKQSEKWWMEIPNFDGKGIFNRSKMIPCSYTDYELATNKGEVPERWYQQVGR